MWDHRFQRLTGRRRTYWTMTNIDTDKVLEGHTFDLTWAESREVFRKGTDMNFKRLYQLASYILLGVLLLSLVVGLLVGTGTAFRQEFYENIKLEKHPVLHIEPDGFWTLSFDEAAELTLYFDGLYDKLGESPYPAPTERHLAELAYEILPIFQYEGFALPQFPADLGLYPYQDGGNHIHIAGQSDCAGFVLNYRFGNPYSSWYNEGHWVAVAIHEMVHVQQGPLCSTVDSLYIEMSAEVITLETLAALVNYGNRDMTYALVRELRGMAASAAYGLALNDGDLDKYIALRNRILKAPTGMPDSYKNAGFDKSRRHWETDPERLSFILEAYSIYPLEQIVQSILYIDGQMTGLIMPPGFVIEYPNSPDVYVPGPPLILDDLMYFLEHADEIVDQYIREKEDEQE